MLFHAPGQRLGELPDRSGEVLTSGGDVEICYVACSIGYGVGVFPDLRLDHLIPRERVTEAYLVRIAEGTRITEILLEFKWQNIVPASPFRGIRIFHTLKNLVQRKGIHRRIYVARLRAMLQARNLVLVSRKSGQCSIQLRYPRPERTSYISRVSRYLGR
jgi:hypothetical protein